MDYLYSLQQRMPHLFYGVSVCEHSSFSDSKKIKHLFEGSKYYVFTDITNIEDKKFDVSLSIDNLHHQENYMELFHNLHRVSSKFVLVRCFSSGKEKNVKGKYQKNLTEKDFGGTTSINKMFDSHKFYYDKQDCNLYFWGVKK